jgi:hypothetical protein
MNILITFLALWFILGGIILVKKKSTKYKSINITKGELVEWRKKDYAYFPIVEYYDKKILYRTHFLRQK